MTICSKAFSFLLAAGMAVATVACGGGSTSMTGPDAAAAAVPPQVGATIAGAVQSGDAAAREIGASSVSGLRVSVTGTSLQATTDGSGRFTLSGVPSGRVELRFQGSGIDARLELEGLQNGQTLTLTIRVFGSSATRVDDDDDDGEVEFKGTVDSVGASSLVVAGKTVTVDASTRLLDHDGMTVPLSGFHQGDFVEVEGTPGSDGTVLATKIKLEDTNEDEDDEENEDEDEDEDEDDDDEENEGQEVEFTGTISSLNPLVIAGRTVKTDGSTRYFGRKKETLPSSEVLKINNKVEVEGDMQPDNSVLAKKIELED